MYKIKFLPLDVEVNIPEGVDILRAAIKAKINIYNSCGGRGLCKKCKVKVIEGNYNTRADSNQNYVLACQTLPRSDLIVEILPESRVIEGEILKGRFFGVQEDLEEAESLSDKRYPLVPLVKKIYLEIPKPEIEDNLADLERILRTLKQKTKLPYLSMPLRFLRCLPENLRSWDWRLTLSYCPDTKKIVNLEKGKTEGLNLGLACDIGTTAVVLYLVDLISGRTKATYADYNKQIAYGEDVITRIVMAEEPQMLEELNQKVIDTINELIRSLVCENKLSSQQINCLVLTGNSTMLHLALKIPPTYIRKTPFIPVLKSPLFLKAEETNIECNPEAVVALMPGVASFVGSDIISGILASGMDKQEQPCIFIDLGTNGEIVLGNKSWMLCCSTSAGPCFEGGTLTSGVRAMKGAIQGFKIQDKKLVVETISEARPIGICGTGIVEIVAEFLINKIIDKAGNFIPQNSERLRLNKYGELEFLIVQAEETGIGRDIVVTQSDIKNLIYSKAAIYMGIEVLLHQVGLKQKEIKKFYIAGGLGTYLNIERAMIIGLLPDLPLERFSFLGNASIQGARLYLISQKARRRALELSQAITNIELSYSLDFMNNYTSSLFLPHTDLEKFPNVRRILKI